VRRLVTGRIVAGLGRSSISSDGANDGTCGAEVSYTMAMPTRSASMEAGQLSPMDRARPVRTRALHVLTASAFRRPAGSGIHCPVAV
jgi:hypothetical protein